MSQMAMRRQEKQMSPEEVETLLGRAPLAHFASVGPDGEPYVVPNLFVYADRRIFLHTANAAGHFARNVRHRPLICFEIAEMGQVFPYGAFECDTSASYESVIGVGTISIEAGVAEKARFFDQFLAKYADPAWQRPRGFYPRLDQVTVYAIEPERLTGKKGPLLARAEQWPHQNRTKSPGAVPPPR
jgi:nitroimidazol reductase NimA-like FMN-containing flavoprotein (pyridoxamine 5'-phosphate oxidase superfamily)